MDHTKFGYLVVPNERLNIKDVTMADERNIFVTNTDEVVKGDVVLCFEDDKHQKFVGVSMVEEVYKDNIAWCSDEDLSGLEYQFFTKKIAASTVVLTEYGIPTITEFKNEHINYKRKDDESF